MDEAADGAGQGACFRCLDMLIAVFRLGKVR